jgi:hypothetical protein
MPPKKLQLSPRKIAGLKKALKMITSDFDDILINPVELSNIPTHIIFQNITNKNTFNLFLLGEQIINIYKTFDIIESARKSIITNKTPKIGIREHSKIGIKCKNINNTKEIIQKAIYKDKKRNLVDFKKMISHFFDIRNDKQIKTKKIESDFKEYLNHLYKSDKENCNKIFLKELSLINEIYSKTPLYQGDGISINCIKKKASYCKILIDIEKAYANWISKGMPLEIYVYCYKNFPIWRKKYKRQGGYRKPSGKGYEAEG